MLYYDYFVTLHKEYKRLVDYSSVRKPQAYVIVESGWPNGQSSK